MAKNSKKRNGKGKATTTTNKESKDMNKKSNIDGNGVDLAFSADIQNRWGEREKIKLTLKLIYTDAGRYLTINRDWCGSNPDLMLKAREEAFPGMDAALASHCMKAYEHREVLKSYTQARPDRVLKAFRKDMREKVLEGNKKKLKRFPLSAKEKAVLSSKTVENLQKLFKEGPPKTTPSGDGDGNNGTLTIEDCGWQMIADRFNVLGSELMENLKTAENHEVADLRRQMEAWMEALTTENSNRIKLRKKGNDSK